MIFKLFASLVSSVPNVLVSQARQFKCNEESTLSYRVSKICTEVSHRLTSFLRISFTYILVASNLATGSAYADVTRMLVELQPLKYHPAFVTFNRDGSRMAVANLLSKDIRIFSVPAFKLIRTFGKPGAVNAIKYSPVNDILAEGDGFSRLQGNRNSIRLWDADSGRLIWEPSGFISGQGPENDVAALVFDPAGRRLLASLYSRHAKRSCCYLFLIDLEKKTTKGFGKCLSESVAFSSKGDRIATGSYDGVSMWPASGNGPLWEKTIQRGSNHNAKVESLAFSPDGSRLVVAADRVVTLHSAANGDTLGTVQVTPRYERVVVGYSPNGKRIVVAADRLWIIDAVSLSVVEETSLPKQAVSLSFSPTGRIFAVGTNGGYVVVKEFLPH